MATIAELFATLSSSGVKLAAKQGRLDCVAPKGVLTADMRSEIARYKLELIALLEARKEEVWQRSRLASGDVLERQLSYWREKLSGVTESLDLATDYPRPGVRSDAGAAHRFTLDRALLGRLQGFTEQQGCTLFMTLLAALQVLLYRYTGQSDLCVGSPIANRQYEETEGLIGMFVNTVALRSYVDGQDSFTGLLAQVKTTCLESYENQDVPFERVVDRLRPERSLAISPLFQVMLVLQNADLGMRTPGYAPYPLQRRVSKFDLTVEFSESADGLAGVLEYSTALYRPETMARLAMHFESLCRALLASPEARLGELDYLSRTERLQLLEGNNPARVSSEGELCLPDLFVKRAVLHPERIAAVCGGREISYGDLERRSRDLGLYLQDLGVQPDSIVGLCTERTLDMLVGLLGILRAGAAYLPLDPAYPEQRLGYMLADSGARIVLTEEKLRSRVAGLLPSQNARLISLDGERDTIAQRADQMQDEGTPLQATAKPHHLAYLIYTSGSTGKPKGVAIEHHSPVTMVRWAGEVYGAEELSGVLASTSLCFDLSVYEIFTTLSHGGKLIVVGNAMSLLDLACKDEVTLINTAPSAVEELLRLGGIPSSVRTVNMAGEALSPMLVDRVYDNSRATKVYDLYGPSEDTTYSTCMLRSKHGPQSIGRPIANTQVYILSPFQQLQPIGVPGELHLAGDGLARGYLNRPELTGEKFIPNPFTPGTRMYRTGDLARWNEDGTLQYLGRMDTQVKIRGFRIELGEVEARLNEYGGVEESVVVAQGEGVDRRLVAFYRAGSGAAEPAYEDLRAHLLERLPEYMVPVAFVALEALPLNPNGKVDRRALTQRDVTLRSSREYVAPRTVVELELVEIWAEVLKQEPERIGIHDSFFELGGHSLLATRLIAKVRSRLDIELPLKVLFTHKTIAQLSEAIAEGNKSQAAPLRPVERQPVLPLSFAQQRMWFADQLEPGGSSYNISWAVSLAGEVEGERIEQAINLLVARHESLRTLFPSEEGEARQLIVDHLHLPVERVDVSGGSDPEQKAQEICMAEAATPFDLASGPLLRVKLIRLHAQQHILMLNMHHIIGDGWSLGVLMRELSQTMQALRMGRHPELPVLPIQYADYSVWQRSRLASGDVLERQLSYWREKLSGVTESLDLATDYPRPGVRSDAGAAHRFTLDRALLGRLQGFTEQQGCTLFMTLLAALQVLLYRYTGQSDLCVGSPIANRQYEETEGLIGMFVNTVALRSYVDGQDSFTGLLAQVKTTCLESYENQDVPFERVVDRLRPERSLAISPLFQVMLVLQNADLGMRTPGYAPYPLQRRVSKFDLTVEFSESADGLAGVLEYSTALYRPETMARLAMHFESLCRALLASPEARLGELDYLSRTERLQLLEGNNPARVSSEGELCLPDLFVKRAVLHPERIAAVCGGREISYGDLERRSRDLGLYLQDLGVQPDSIVGLCTERTLDMLVGLLGILRAGAAYLPLDPAYPEQRLGYMLADSGARIVLTEEKLRTRVAGLLPSQNARLISLDGERDTIAQRADQMQDEGTPLQASAKPHHLAYLIYTSGSTGKPKGVAIEHHSPVTMVRWAGEVYGTEELSGVLASTSLCFDLSVYEIFTTLSHGGKLIVVGNAMSLLDLACKDEVTLINTAPSAVEELLRLGGIPSSVRTVNMAGEALSPMLVDRVYDNSLATKVYDLYGPSEDTTYSTYMLRTKHGPQSIGRPIANTQVYILSPFQQLQPIGVPGELHLAGDGLARGYLNRPELTEEKFIPNPFTPGTRMYRTGDLARWNEDGTLQYLGRMDTQVKIRGFRIELGEVEARLNEYGGVEESVVVAQGEGVDRRLVAFYRAGSGAAEPAYEDLRAHLLERLPEYMVPVAFVALEALPLNPNGKVDRRALTQRDVTLRSSREYVAPRTVVELELVEIWAEVLKQEPERIGIHDSFFELGGHSLLATRLIAKVRSRLDIELPLKVLFTHKTIAQLSEAIAEGNKSQAAPLRPVERQPVLPLSFAQQRMWFADQLEPGGSSYNISWAVSLAGDVEGERIEQAINLLVARHESLRTLFPSEEGEARQLILDHLHLPVERVDVSGGSDPEQKAQEICMAEAATPFDLASGPLLRVKLIRLHAQQHILMLNMHHIIGDGWSLGVLMRELSQTMEALRMGRHPELPVLPIQYADYSVWQRSRLASGDVLERQLSYWREKLSGVTESLDLATDYPRPGVRSDAGAAHRFTLDRALLGRLQGFTEQQGCTLFMTLLAAFQVLLYRYTGQSDLCVGSPIANRQYEETEGLIGMFVNTVALRSYVDGQDSFTGLLAQVKTTCLESYENQDVPFERVVDRLRPERSLAISPLFQVMLVLQNADLGMRTPGYAPYPLQRRVSKFDLTVEFSESADGLAGVLEYSTALYRPETMARLAMHFESLCRALLASPEARLGELDYLSRAERLQLLEGNNPARVFSEGELCLPDLFVKRAVLHPERIAAVCGGREISYGDLERRSRDLGLYLQDLGVQPDSIVGLCTERTLDMLVGLLGILRAGAAYLPLDPAYPEQRLGYMLADSGARIVLTEEKLRTRVAGLLPSQNARLISLDGERDTIAQRADQMQDEGTPLQASAKPHHLAYLIYTSGSTGKPKGVAIEHHSPVTMVRWAGEVYGTEELSGVLASTSLCFDLSVYEIFTTLSHGGKLIVVGNAMSLLDLACKDEVTLINTAPSAVEELLRLGGIPSSVRTVNMAGEALSPMLVDRVYDNSRATKVYDLYGPSEDTTYSTYMLRTKHGPQSIGRPIANTQVYILSPFQQLQPIGVPGELHLAGDGLARGYLNRPELTEEKFIPNPFTPGTRMYRTGDLARWNEDGTLQYLGRMDTQVKIRGFRIELGEVEARLNEYGGVEESVVVAQGEGVDRRLVAFYRAGSGAAEPAYEDLRAHLLERLPEYMVPVAFVALEALPLNPNGKVDRRALTQRDVTLRSSREYVAPRTVVELELVEIWAEVLKQEPERIGIHDSFFELGGHSLLATRLIAKVRSRLDIELPLKVLFTHKTIAQLSEAIAEGNKSQAAPLRPVERQPVLPLSFAQQRMWFADQLEPGGSSYNISWAVSLAGDVEGERIEQAINLLVARHESLRTLFPSEEGEARQLILDHLHLPVERVDVSGGSDPEQKAQEICMAEAATPFDLASGPLLRVKLIRLHAQQHILMLNMHHIIGDGWSLGVLMRELSQTMEALRMGRHPELPVLPIQYADYSVWQRSRLASGDVLERQLSYWREKLSGVTESLDLATDYPRPGVRSDAGAAHRFTLDRALLGRLQGFTEQQGCTLFMTLLAAFQVLLYRYTGQSDLCVGSPIANRQYEETEGLIGMFVNTVALRSYVDGQDSFTGLLAQVKTTCLESYENQDVPFERVVDRLRPERSLAISPLFQVMLVLQNADLGMRTPGYAPYPLQRRVSKFDLTVEFSESADGLAGVLEYSTALYRPETMARLAMHFESLCRALLASPEARLGELDYLSRAERLQLLEGNNPARVFSEGELCLPDLFVKRAVLHPERIAAVCGGREISYGDLERRSRDLGLYLQDLGVQPDSIVGLCTERTLDMLVGLLGILRAGAAYLPLDPAYPEQRLGYMLADSGARIVLTEEKLRTRVAGLLPSQNARLISLDGERDTIAQRADQMQDEGTPLQASAKPHHLAYLIYTSGSTGKPKAVMIEHRNIMSYVTAILDKLHLPEGSSFGYISTFAADLGYTVLFPSLLGGGTVYILSREEMTDPDCYADFCRQHRVDCLKITPSHLRALIGERSDAWLIPAGTLVFGGETLSPEMVDLVRSIHPACRIYNHYGPTECSVGAICGEVPAALIPGIRSIRLGQPFGETSLYILDGHRQLVPVGIVGELHIGGPQVARGYRNEPSLTTERFVPDPFVTGARMYRTGDLARWLEDGTVEFLGRNDFQVKIRGFRVELGEIETRLREHALVQGAVVLVRDDGGTQRLIAYYTCPESSEMPKSDNEEQLRDWLLAQLPDYATPAAFVRLDAIPLNANGKVDQHALLRLDVKLTSGREYAAPRTDVEVLLVQIWAEVLKLEPERIGVNDSFFSLGGHSLLATQLIAKIRNRLNIRVELKALFERPSIAQFAEVVLKAKRSEIPRIQPINRTQREQLPLSFAQERVWFFDQLEPDRAGYTIPRAVTIHGEFDGDRLEEALNFIIVRHENLRTVFPSHDGKAQQVILPSLAFKIERIDLSEALAGPDTGHNQDQDMAARANRAKEICEREASTPFNLAHGPLLRVKAIKLAEQHHILMFHMHHIISDGWSTGVLIKELSLTLKSLRQGGPAILPPLPIQYADYSVWQRGWLEESGLLDRQLSYWRTKLSGVSESLDLSTDYPRPRVQSFAGATYSFVLDADLAERLRSLGQKRGSTLYMVLLSAFKVLLYRYTGQQDVCVGSLIANRQYAETAELIGMFVNTLALRSQLDGEDTFAALLSQVRNTCLEAYENQDVPFEKVVEAVRVQRSMASRPLFQVMMILHNVETGDLDRQMEPYEVENQISQFDLIAGFLEQPEGLSGLIAYSTALFKPETIARLADHFTRLCRAITATPTARLCDLDFLGETERERLLLGFNDTRADYPCDTCMHSLFAAQVALHGERTAVRFGEHTLSYRALAERSGSLGLSLQSLGVVPDQVVGLCVERSLEMLVGILGIVEGGGAYLPLDPEYPDDRLAYMLQDSGAQIVLTQEKFRARLGSLLGQDAQVIALDTQWEEILSQVSSLRDEGVVLREEVGPQNACYVIYTSGSTGKPKGVLIEHRSLVNRIHWMQRSYQLEPTDVVLQKTPYSFDVSVWEFFWPLMAGASLVFAIPDGHKDVEYLEDLMNREQVTTLHFVPSMLDVFLAHGGGPCRSVQRVFCSGEALGSKPAGSYRSRFPSARLYNLYGPTEAAIDVTAFDCTGLDSAFVPIGRPIDNTQIYILDGYERLQPVGVPGELHIAGDGLARGYLKRPKLTQEKFVDNPFTAGTRMYRTGDRARWLDDGNIQYLGRLDTQVKIRGFRIELGEVEAQLEQHPMIEDSAVIAHGEPGNQQLVAFYSMRNTERGNIPELAGDTLRAHLLQTLPEYMVPMAFVPMMAIPLSSNGKVDRGALERMEVTISSSAAFVAPRNEAEKQMVEIWAGVLNQPVETIGVNDNFFELGGHSLLAVTLIERMRQQGLNAGLQALFATPTLAALAAACGSGESTVMDPTLDLASEVSLDPTITACNDGELGELHNVFLTGATGFLGAFLLSDLLAETSANVYCLVRAADLESGYKKIERALEEYGLSDPRSSTRILPVLGDLEKPGLGLGSDIFEKLAGLADAIYHNGAAVNFYYPYSALKAANVLSTVELLRMAGTGKRKSFHYVSTLGIALADNRPLIADGDPLPDPRHIVAGYPQTKWVAENIVAIASSRGIPVITYRPGTIMGHSRTGASSLEDFTPSFLRGCIQAGCVPEVNAHSELHLMPVDFVSRSIVAISQRADLFGRVLNLTNALGTTGQELLDQLSSFDPSLQKVTYEMWRGRVASDPGNPLARYLPSFPEDILVDYETPVRSVFDVAETLAIMETAGIVNTEITEELYRTYFSYLAAHTAQHQTGYPVPDLT